MKIKLDENLPESLVSALKSLGHQADSVRDERLTGHPDEDVWQAAQKEQRFVITQDLDFSDLRDYQSGTHSGVLLLRLQFPSRSALTSRVRQLFATEDVEDWKGCLVVATEKKLRIRKTG